MPTDYQKTKIYKIESHLGDKIYAGSTAKEYLSQRFQLHKVQYKRWKNGVGVKYTSFELFDEYGLENCNIVLIEAYPCNSKDEKNAKEGHYIKTLECVNKIVVGRTVKEYQQSDAGKEAVKKAVKKYQQSDAGKEAAKKYKQSDSGKEAVKKASKKYQQSDAGKAYQKEYQKNYYQRKKAKKLEQLINAN